MCQTDQEGKPFMVAAILESLLLYTLYRNSVKTAYLKIMKRDKSFCLCKAANTIYTSKQKTQCTINNCLIEPVPALIKVHFCSDNFKSQFCVLAL